MPVILFFSLRGGLKIISPFPPTPNNWKKRDIKPRYYVIFLREIRGKKCLTFFPFFPPKRYFFPRLLIFGNILYKKMKKYRLFKPWLPDPPPIRARTPPTEKKIWPFHTWPASRSRCRRPDGGADVCSVVISDGTPTGAANLPTGYALPLSGIAT